MTIRFEWLPFVLALTACEQTTNFDGTVSLLGKPLRARAMTEERRAKLMAEWREAERTWKADPRDEDAIVWFGRRTAYLGRHLEAIDIFTRGLEFHPRSARLYRHRGHRYITTRQLDRAIEDLALAAELAREEEDRVEPDGIPNEQNVPLTTTHGNIYYHLGLAHYLRGEFEEALAAFSQRIPLGRNDDNHCSTTYWRYLILRRLDRPREAVALLASISADMNVIENFAYHRLLLLYRGEASPEDFPRGDGDAVHSTSVVDATTAYGVSMWHFIRGDHERARAMWTRIVSDETAMDAFGYIAAEAELARVGRATSREAQTMETPWSVTFQDGSGNEYRFVHEAEAQLATFEYTPVEPHESSSGVYDGGRLRKGTLPDPEAAELWRWIDELADDDSLHAETRAMGTGRFQVEWPGGRRAFLIANGPRLQAFLEFLEPFSGKP